MLRRPRTSLAENAAPLAALLALAALAACDDGRVPPLFTNARADRGPGPRVVWDLGARPFPEVPLPNDIATWPDPTSPTGVRLNASLVAPTGFERSLRAQFDELDGWGTFMPLTVAFEDDLDVSDLAARHRNDTAFDFSDDAVYLVNLATGVPVPLDLGHGNFPLTHARPEGWLPNDPRASGSNLLLATVDEDTNRDGFLQPEEDTNHDGVLQRAALLRPGARPEDALASFWEPESRTLILRPLVPLEERTRYAVVLTDRLRGRNGPVRSPFDTVAHPTQLAWLAPLERHLADPERSRRFFGGLAWRVDPNAPSPALDAGGDAADAADAGRRTPRARVAFAWTFQTQTTVTDMVDVHRGLHGEGRLRNLARVTPDFTVSLARSASCNGVNPANRYVVPAAQIQTMMRDLLPVIGLSGAQAEALIRSFDWVDHLAIARVQTPYLLGNPRGTDPDARWNLAAVAREGAAIARDEVQLWIYVPKAREGASQPFPVAFNAHGYGSGPVQSIAFAGYFARFGIATVAATAPVHGLPFPPNTASAFRTLLRGMCLGPLGDAAVAGRARDLNGDGSPDSGGDFVTARIFHTRDLVRQTALDYMQVTRAMTDPSWSRPGAVDYNGDGRADAPGDLDGDGTVDVGGQREGRDLPFYMWGESLGGITAMVVGAIDPALTAVAPVSGGAGLTDVALRTTIQAVASAAVIPAMAPVLVSVPAEDRAPANGRTRTACRAGEASLRFVVPDVGRVGELEIACTGGASGALTPGDDVVVYNHATDSERCARVPADGRLFLPIAADLNDRLTVSVYTGHVVSDYRTCARPFDLRPRLSYDRFEVGEGDCDVSCGHVPPDAAEGTPARMRGYRRMALLVAPASGLGLRRQTAELRRFLQLAQAGVDPGDPANFAPLFFLRPRAAQPRPLLTFTTVGDTDVPVATGNAFARAAGLIPFVATDTGSALDEYTVPTPIAARYPRTPNQLLIDNFVLEGLSRLRRTPGSDPRWLFDIDNLDEGRQRYGERALSPPLRLVRAARPVRAMADAALVSTATARADIDRVWQPRPGEPLAAFFNGYVVPEGTHTFLPSDPSRPWDEGAYYTNLIARFFQSNGTDVPYFTDPTGHQCLADSSCAFIPRAPPAP